MNTNDLYFIYLRKSREDIEAEKIGKYETLKIHEERLLKLAAEMDIKIGKIYRELVSGDTIADRPVFQHVLQEVAAGMWKGGLVTESSRLARGDSEDQGIVLKIFRDSDTLIVTPRKTYDLNRDSDEDAFEMDLFMSRFEFKWIKRRLQDGRNISRRKGDYIYSVPPFGLNKAGKTLEKNDDFYIVRQAFEMYDKGASMGNIGRWAASVYPSKKWQNSAVRDILINPVYIGKMRYNVKPTTKERLPDGTVIVHRCRDKNAEIIDGNWPAFIEEDLFYRVNNRLKLNPPVDKDHLKNVFAGLIRCKKCGRVMVFNRTKYSVQLIHQRGRYVEKCDQHNTVFAPVKENIINYLANVADNLSVSLKDNPDNARAASRPQTTEDEIKAAKAQAERRLEGLYDKYERGIYDDGEFISRRSKLQQEISALNDQIQKMQRNTRQSKTNEERILLCREAVEMLRDPNININAVNMFLKSFIDRIDYDRPEYKGEIHLSIIFL